MAMLAPKGLSANRKGLRAYVGGYVGHRRGYVGVVGVGKRIFWFQVRIGEVIRGCGRM